MLTDSTLAQTSGLILLSLLCLVRGTMEARLESPPLPHWQHSFLSHLCGLIRPLLMPPERFLTMFSFCPSNLSMLLLEWSFKNTEIILSLCAWNTLYCSSDKDQILGHSSGSSTYSGFYLPLQTIVLPSPSLCALTTGTCFHIPTSTLSFTSRPLCRLFSWPGPLFYSTFSLFKSQLKLPSSEQFLPPSSYRILHLIFPCSHHTCDLLFTIYLPL